MSTEAVVYALEEWLRASAELEKAREGYDGGSWGYHGHSFIVARENAAARFETALNAVIDERVAAAIKRHSEE